MKITATQVKGRDLQPGDLFSIRGQAYWDLIDLRGSVGESVYVRTRIPADQFPDADATVFKIEVSHDEDCSRQGSEARDGVHGSPAPDRR